MPDINLPKQMLLNAKLLALPIFNVLGGKVLDIKKYDIEMLKTQRKVKIRKKHSRRKVQTSKTVWSQIQFILRKHLLNVW